MKKFLFLFLFFITCCKNNIEAQTDSTADCFDAFFTSSTPIKNKSSVKLLVEKGKTTTLAVFTKADGETKPMAGLKDLDGDGVKELIVWDYTGGAHCCDEFYFFKSSGANQYSYVAKLYAGNTCVDAQNNFVYNLHESFGYFFTCFACGLTSDEDGKQTKGLTVIDDINLHYKAGKLLIQSGDAALKSTIKKNLVYIKNLGWDGGVPDDEFDDGRRKELALNLAAYYFLFGKNLVETKSLFTTYYPFKDAAKVWTQFMQNLNNVKKNNDF